MRRLGDLLLSGLLAPPCAVCGRVLERPLAGAVCADCWRAIRPITPPLCARCGNPLPSAQAAEADGRHCATCLGSDSLIECARAIGGYEGALREIVHALKYERRRSLVPELAARMRASGADVLSGSDALIPVPLHPRRRRARGFNQARVLADAIGGPVWDVLVRIRHTAPQVDLHADARRSNVEGAFALAVSAMALRTARFIFVRRGWALVERISEKRSSDHRPSSRFFGPFLRNGPYGNQAYIPLVPPDLNGAVLVLVDDVTTTGATLEECAHVLKAAGAREVRALTAARVVSAPRSEWSR